MLEKYFLILFDINLIPLVLNILNHEIFSLHKKEEYTPLRSLKNESKGLTNLEGRDEKKLTKEGRETEFPMIS